ASGRWANNVSPRSSDTTSTPHSAADHPGLAIRRDRSDRRSSTSADTGARGETTDVEAMLSGARFRRRSRKTGYIIALLLGGTAARTQKTRVSNAPRVQEKGHATTSPRTPTRGPI